jgi:hypothetical protein
MGGVEAINSKQHGLKECKVDPAKDGMILLNPKGIRRINDEYVNLLVVLFCVVLFHFCVFVSF